ncbi:hypothetical protein PV327_009452 [Microctonus hyperodae]|uniref:Uncharacterized protein n=1 Tax=Microctonus hyperodae TaxID=165561 RepID=A0AA39FTU1_MICHY|nr:hypothetical protein PV327_009452 [Microctonus hyperodae]
MKHLFLVLVIGCMCHHSSDGRRTVSLLNWLTTITDKHDYDTTKNNIEFINETIIYPIKRFTYDDSSPPILSNQDKQFYNHKNHQYHIKNSKTHHGIRHANRLFRSIDYNPRTFAQNNWPVKKEAIVEGNLVLGGLMMVHEREDSITCGPVMPQGGIQALEAMLYTLDWLNDNEIVPGVKIGAHILDDCDKDTYGLEMAVDFIKDGIFKAHATFHSSLARKFPVV